MQPNESFYSYEKAYMNNAFRLRKFICTLFISLLKCVQLKFRQSINLVIVWIIFIKGINPILLDVSFGQKVWACKMKHISAVIQSQHRPIYVDSSAGSNSQKYETAI